MGGDEIHVPIVEEEIVVPKRLVAREELVIRKRQVVQAEVRKERAHVAKTSEKARPLNSSEAGDPKD